MRRLVAFAAIAFVVYFVVTEVLPQLEDRFNDFGNLHPGTTGGDVGACVARARDANFGVVDILRSVRPGNVNPAGWDRKRRRMDSLISDASRFCLCHLPACDQAGRALDLMREQVDDFEAAVTGRRAPTNVGRTQAQIDRLLERAERSARRDL